MQKKYLEAGRVVGTHGVRGELRVDSWCDSPEFLSGFKKLYWDEGRKPVEVLAARPHKTLVLMKLAGIDTATQADVLRGRILYIDRADARLPKDSYFIQDLLGLSAVDADTGVSYGKLTDVFKTGANDVYEITGDNGKQYLIPVIPDVIIETDLEAETLRIRPIRGIFDED